jgi:hypothetical protein
MTIAEVPEFLSEKKACLPEACEEYLKSRSYRCVESEQGVACRFPRRKDQTTWMFESWSVSSSLRLTRTSPKPHSIYITIVKNQGIKKGTLNFLGGLLM